MNKVLFFSWQYFELYIYCAGISFYLIEMWNIFLTFVENLDTAFHIYCEMEKKIIISRAINREFFFNVYVMYYDNMIFRDPRVYYLNYIF